MNLANTGVQRHDQFYLDTTTFLVIALCLYYLLEQSLIGLRQLEDTRFKVPSRYFYENSEIFRAAVEISETERSPDANLVRLPLPGDASASDFTQLLRVVYALSVTTPTRLH